jgi:hypothetical protein
VTLSYKTCLPASEYDNIYAETSKLINHESLPLNILYYGEEDSLPEQHHLQAGLLTATLANGELLNICWRGAEVCTEFMWPFAIGTRRQCRSSYQNYRSFRS